MKVEKTCKCVKSTPNIYRNEQSKEFCSFIEGREYQVDVYMTSSDIHYKIYQNGGWEDWVMLEQEEFDKWFKEIC